MTRNRPILRFTGLIAAWTMPLLFFAAKNLTASLYTPVTSTRVVIDGTDYGPFNNISGLDRFKSDGSPSDQSNSYAEVVLSRDFVTDPSLYLWAQKLASKKTTPQNIELLTQDESGNTISRKVLELSQPFTWSVETKSPSTGGFNETVGFAVRKLSIF